jgi:tRNA-(ms[2]io[6]A)-hydroxylase
MLRLASDTPERWVTRALEHVDTLLLDHAHCEKKAASTAINLMFRYGDRTPLVRAMSAVAREELEHLDLMIDVLERRGLAFGRLAPSPYAQRLHAAIRPDEPLRLLDTLLCCALVEARSCERMKLLSEHLPDDALRGLYRGLLASEARHHQLYVDLARAQVPDEDVDARLAELARHEAAILRGEDEPPRMHAAVA